MMKKNFYFLLMAVLVCGLSLSVTSCKDDDKDNNGGTDTGLVEDGLSEEDAQAWSWIGVLTDEAAQETGWQNKSYDVTIGLQSDNDPGARLIIVSDLDEARANFASLAGCAPDDLNGSKTVSAGNYGSMTWNISEQGAPNIATVEVKSPLFKMTKLIYCTEEQAPDNASNITGNCWYRLGDVVEDEDGFYWVCVQPSFLGKKNNDSYWVNIFNAAESGRGKNTGKLPGIPSKFICSKYNKNKKYNNNIILLPTGLKENRQQNYNLANLIWALLKPDKYLDKIKNSSTGLAGLPSKYHGKQYLKEVDEKWEKYSIYEKLFNCTRAQMREFDTFHFFYNGYHWKTGTTAGVWIYYSEEYEPKYSGSLKDDDILYEMTKAGYGFDVRRYASDPKHDKNCASTNKEDMAPAKQFIYDDAYWVIRVATGKQLDKNYKPYEKMKTVYDIYNFNITGRQFDYRCGAKEHVCTDEELAKQVKDENEVYD
jgi:hypothetical protein